MNNTVSVLDVLLPAVSLAAGALLCALLALLRPRTPSSFYRWITVVAVIVAFVRSLLELHALNGTSGTGLVTNEGGLVGDRFHVFGCVVAQAIVLLTVLGADAYMRRVPARAGAFCALLLLGAAATAMLLAQREMSAFTASFALLVVALVSLTAMTKTSSLTAEAAFRQVIIGGVALATAVYGLTLLYSATGTTDLTRLATGARTSGTPIDPVLSVVGIALVVIGILVAAGATPMQAWIRHAEEAGPGPIAGFTAAIATVAATMVLARYAVEAFGPGSRHWTVLVDVVAALTMISGSVLAVRATTIRRLVADLSIVQAGVLLLALAATGKGISGVTLAGPTALLYGLMGAVAGLVAVLLLAGIFDAAGLGTSLESYRGVGRRAPATAAFLTLSLFALAGLPPLAGFVARLLIAESVVDAGSAWVAVIAAAAMALAAVAVIRWLRAMYAEDDLEAPFAVRTTPLVSRVTAWTAALLGLLLAAFAGPLVSLAGGAATALH